MEMSALTLTSRTLALSVILAGVALIGVGCEPREQHGRLDEICLGELFCLSGDFVGEGAPRHQVRGGGEPG